LGETIVNPLARVWSRDQLAALGKLMRIYGRIAPPYPAARPRRATSPVLHLTTRPRWAFLIAEETDRLTRRTAAPA
jgi:hypothetical protein